LHFENIWIQPEAIIGCHLSQEETISSHRYPFDQEWQGTDGGQGFAQDDSIWRQVMKFFVSDKEILDATGLWMRYCAVEAHNETISTSGNLDFDTWFLCCESTWVNRIGKSLWVSKSRIKSVLKEYAIANAHRSSELLAELNAGLKC
jgi:hypothetical protein